MMERGALVRLKSRAAGSAPGSAPSSAPSSTVSATPSSGGLCPVWASPFVGRRWFRRRRKPGPAASAAQTGRRGQRGGRRLFLLVTLHNRPLPSLLRGASGGSADDSYTFLSFCGSKAEAVAQAAAVVVRLWTRFVPPLPSETWGEGLLDPQCLPLLLVACAAAAWSGQWHVSS